MRISDWSSDVCSSDLLGQGHLGNGGQDILAKRPRQHIGSGAITWLRPLPRGLSQGERSLADTVLQAHKTVFPNLHAPNASGLGWRARLDRKSTRLNSSH